MKEVPVGELSGKGDKLINPLEICCHFIMYEFPKQTRTIPKLFQYATLRNCIQPPMLPTSKC